MRMFEYAYCGHDYAKKILTLSEMAPEKWSFESKSDNSILINYIEHTFSKVYHEGKVSEFDNHSLFNTGLYSEYNEPIFAYFIKNRNPDRQIWFFEGFHTKYQLGMMGVQHFPERAYYFSDPSALVFNAAYAIHIQNSHIFGDQANVSRIPESVRYSPSKIMLFEAAVQHAKYKIEANYKTAIPQYYNGKIQLLIPISLVNPTQPDLALVCSLNEDRTAYWGHTCLTLEMAYNNARLIARPDSLWLIP
jgi:hypothetical protein